MKYQHRTPFTIALLSLSLGSAALAQQPVKESPLQVDVCHAQAEVLSSSQKDSTVMLAIEVSVDGCDGVCTGSVEYDLVFSDANDKETLWHMTKPWNWRSVDESFVLNIEKQAAPGTTLKAANNITIGRCSCSETQAFGS